MMRKEIKCKKQNIKIFSLMNVKQENAWAFTSSIIQISVFGAFALGVQLSMLLFLFVF